MILDRSPYNLGDIPAQPDYTGTTSALPASATALLPSLSPYVAAVVAQMQADGFQVSNMLWVNPLVFTGTLATSGGASYNFSLQISDLQNLSATRKARSLEQFISGTPAPAGMTIPRSRYADWFSNEAPTPAPGYAVPLVAGGAPGVVSSGLVATPVPMPLVYAPPQAQGTTIPMATSDADTAILQAGGTIPPATAVVPATATTVTPATTTSSSIFGTDPVTGAATIFGMSETTALLIAGALVVAYFMLSGGKEGGKTK
jgi:hypothetical protein